MDYRRFGNWTINGDWGSDRGPDTVVEYKEFRQNVLDNLKNPAFNKAICETLLNAFTINKSDIKLEYVLMLQIR